MELIDSQNNDTVILGNVVVRRPRHPDAIASKYLRSCCPISTSAAAFPSNS